MVLSGALPGNDTYLSSLSLSLSLLKGERDVEELKWNIAVIPPAFSAHKNQGEFFVAAKSVGGGGEGSWGWLGLFSPSLPTQ